MRRHEILNKCYWKKQGQEKKQQRERERERESWDGGGERARRMRIRLSSCLISRQRAGKIVSTRDVPSVATVCVYVSTSLCVRHLNKQLKTLAVLFFTAKCPLNSSSSPYVWVSDCECMCFHWLCLPCSSMLLPFLVHLLFLHSSPYTWLVFANFREHSLSFFLSFFSSSCLVIVALSCLFYFRWSSIQK